MGLLAAGSHVGYMEMSEGICHWIHDTKDQQRQKSCYACELLQKHLVGHGGKQDVELDEALIQGSSYVLITPTPN